ncbi:MAG: hypothetical protein ABFD92_11430 [Planctomycetaceae bacterium]|nr:hypothetical protein [Planctomycetaceae bacterium]
MKKWTIVAILVLCAPLWAAPAAEEAPPVDDSKVVVPQDVLDEVKASFNEKAPAAVEGVVFLDANANGKRDAGEKGLAGVGVNDGMHFAVTGEDGAYTLTLVPDPAIPWNPARCVSMTWPSNYWPTGKWFYRLSEVPTGKGVDFGLREDKQTLPFAFMHTTDGHGTGGEYPGVARDIALMGPMLRMHFETGDVLYANYSQPPESIMSFRRLAANIKRANFPVPTFAVPGNHDNTGCTVSPDKHHPDHPLFCHGVWTKYVGPHRWSFNYGGCHFVGVDWRNPKAQGLWGDEAPQAAADFMKADFARLKDGARIFQFVHFPTGVGEYHQVVKRVTQAYGGHNHRFAEYNYGCPSVTAKNCVGNGSSNVTVVTENDFAVVNRCPGCKADRNYHSKLCSYSQLRLVVLPKLTPLRTKATVLADKPLGKETVSTGGAPVEIDADIQVGSAKRTGIKIGQSEIVFEGDTLTVDGVAIPFKPWPEQKNTLSLHVAASKDFVIVYANNLIRLHKRAKIGPFSEVTFFAEGGQAQLKQATVWPLKPSAEATLPNLGYPK